MGANMLNNLAAARIEMSFSDAVINVMQVVNVSVLKQSAFSRWKRGGTKVVLKVKSPASSAYQKFLNISVARGGRSGGRNQPLNKLKVRKMKPH